MHANGFDAVRDGGRGMRGMTVEIPADFAPEPCLRRVGARQTCRFNVINGQGVLGIWCEGGLRLSRLLLRDGTKYLACDGRGKSARTTDRSRQA